MDVSTEILINFHGFQQISDLFHGCFNKLQIFREPLQERAARLSDEAMAAQVRFSAIFLKFGVWLFFSRGYQGGFIMIQLLTYYSANDSRFTKF